MEFTLSRYLQEICHVNVKDLKLKESYEASILMFLF